MKINDIKHNHSLTDLLKVGIFSILMLAPLIAIGTTCAYAIVNKNAYISYSNFNKDNNEYEVLNNWNELIQGRTYRFSGNDTFTSLTNTTVQRFNVSNIQMIASSQTSSMVLDIETNCNGFGMWRDTSLGHNYIRFYNDSAYITTGGFNSYSYVFTFTFEGYYNMNTSNDLSYYTGNMFTESTLNNNTNTLDNAFYYATEKMTQSDLFNWTENTAIYTGVSAMCTQLDIETNVIPILIVYWFILTIIYVIIDIVLKCFTTLTHMISKEAH